MRLDGQNGPQLVPDMTRVYGCIVEVLMKSIYEIIPKLPRLSKTLKEREAELIARMKVETYQIA